MTDTEIIEALRARLALPVGRHLYGVLGTYPALDRFAAILTQATAPDGRPFPPPLNVNRGILQSIPDDEFRTLVETEARTPEPTAAHVARAFESWLRAALKEHGLVVLKSLELLFAYRVELNLLRVLAADDQRIVLLLPGRRRGDQIVLYPEAEPVSYTLPINLIAENHLWELRSS